MKKNQVLGIIGVIIAAVAAYATSKLPPSNIASDPGPALYPYFMCCILGIASIFTFFQKSNNEKPFMNKQQLLRMFFLLFLFIVFAVCIYIFGFYYVAPVMLFVLCYLFSVGKKTAWYKVLFFAICVWAIIYVVFKILLKMPLPRGILF